MMNKRIGKKGVITIVIICTITLGALLAMNKGIFDREFNNGTDIKMESLNENQINRLNKLCKVWGFTKYYHPEVISGSVNWDYELFRTIPKIMDAKDSNEVDEVLYNWIVDLGEIEEQPYDNNNEVMLEADISWIKDDSYVTKQLSDLLVKMSKTNISNRDKAYVNFKEDPLFANMEKEEAYLKMKYDDDGFKLLSLFRYWNIIQYYYPYRTVMEENWNAVLNEFIPKFIESDDELAYKLTVAELTTKIHDSHAVVVDENGALDKYWGTKMAPIKFDLVEGKVVVTNKKHEKDANIQTGDVILAINGKDIFEVIKEKSKYLSFSNDKAIVNNLSPYLFRTSDDNLTLTIERNGVERKEEVKCYNIRSYQEKEKSHKLLDGNIGYINPGFLEAGEIHKIMSKFLKTDGLIVDLRYYPSDFIVYSLGEYLMPKKVMFAKATVANKVVPGEFVFDKDLEVGKDNPDYYKGRVIILVNESTQSQGEFTAMSFRNAPNATVIGNNTIGADGNALLFPLPGGITTRITGIGIYNPDKSETQRVGIKPDIYVRPTIEGIRVGRDELVEKAVELIKQ